MSSEINIPVVQQFSTDGLILKNGLKLCSDRSKKEKKNANNVNANNKMQHIIISYNQFKMGRQSNSSFTQMYLQVEARTDSSINRLLVTHSSSKTMKKQCNVNEN